MTPLSCLAQFARAIVKLAVAVGEADVRILVTPEPENEAVLDMLMAASGARNLAVRAGRRGRGWVWCDRLRGRRGAGM